MIQEGSFLEVADNSGVRLVKCVKVLGGSKKRSAGCCEMIVVSARKVAPKSSSSVKKGDVCLAVIVRTKAPIHRADGSVISFRENAVVLLDKQHKMLGTRVSGVVPRELRADFLRITTLVNEVI